MPNNGIGIRGTDEPAASPRVYLILAERDSDRERIIAGLPQDAEIHLADMGDQAALTVKLATCRPDVLICAYETPDNIPLAAFQAIGDTHPLPIILFTERDSGQMAQRVLAAGVSAYIVNALSADRVLPVTQVAIQRFRMMSALHSELKKSRDEIAARKIIERAKGVLMERRGLSEQAAYEAMRRLAMTKARPLREIADMILSVSDILP